MAKTAAQKKAADRALAELKDQVVLTACDLVKKRTVAAALANHHGTGPGGVKEAMRDVGVADRALTEAVLALESWDGEDGVETSEKSTDLAGPTDSTDSTDSSDPTD